MSVSRDSETSLWHFRIAHPSFQYLKNTFPSITLNKTFDFQCEICEFLKHQCTSFPKLKYKPSKSFTIISNDFGVSSTLNHIHKK